MKKYMIILVILVAHLNVFANEGSETKVTISIPDQLKILQTLYENGSLSGYKYEKKKKKILNQ